MKALNRFNLICVIIVSSIFQSCEKEIKNGTVTDIEGNVYQTIKIGNQWWMQENLKTTSLTDGTLIPNVTGNSDWQNLSTPGYCWYNNEILSFKDPFGALYNWHAVNTGKLCPTGWHVPSDSEWSELETHIGGVDVAAAKLRQSGTTLWQSPNTGATNESGFTALPGGYRNANGVFYGILTCAGFFTSTAKNDRDALIRAIYSNNVYTPGGYWKTAGYSIRCIKDN